MPYVIYGLMYWERRAFGAHYWIIYEENCYFTPIFYIKNKSEISLYENIKNWCGNIHTLYQYSWQYPAKSPLVNKRSNQNFRIKFQLCTAFLPTTSHLYQIPSLIGSLLRMLPYRELCQVPERIVGFVLGCVWYNFKIKFSKDVFWFTFCVTAVA